MTPKDLREKINDNTICLIEAPKGLGRWNEALEYYYRKIARIELELSRDRRRKSKDQDRWNTIDYYNNQIKLIKKLGGKCTKDTQTKIYECVLSDEISRLNSYYCKQFEETNLRIELNGDGMVNLNKLDLEFESTSFDTWSVEVTKTQLDKFIYENELRQKYNGDLIDSYNPKSKLLKNDEKWGRVSKWNKYRNEFN